MKKFLKVKFIQSTELAGVGYSSVGGPARDGVYHSVPVEALSKSDYAEALAKDGLLEILGDGDSPETAGDKVQPEEQAAFKDSGMTEAQWLAKQPVERGALVGAYNGKVAAAQAADGERAVKAAAKANDKLAKKLAEEKEAADKKAADEKAAAEKKEADDKEAADKAAKEAAKPAPKKGA